MAARPAWVQAVRTPTAPPVTTRWRGYLYRRSIGSRDAGHATRMAAGSHR